jgi:hypothetical protein
MDQNVYRWLMVVACILALGIMLYVARDVRAIRQAAEQAPSESNQ